MREDIRLKRRETPCGTSQPCGPWGDGRESELARGRGSPKASRNGGQWHVSRALTARSRFEGDAISSGGLNLSSVSQPFHLTSLTLNFSPVRCIGYLPHIPVVGTEGDKPCQSLWGLQWFLQRTRDCDNSLRLCDTLSRCSSYIYILCIYKNYIHIYVSITHTYVYNFKRCKAFAILKLSSPCGKRGWWVNNGVDRIWLKCVFLMAFFHFSVLTLIFKGLLNDKDQVSKENVS